MIGIVAISEQDREEALRLALEAGRWDQLGASVKSDHGRTRSEIRTLEHIAEARRLLRLPVIGLLACLIASPVMAGPILTNVTGGCVSSLPADAWWESAEHFRFAAFADPIAGCDATTYAGISPFDRVDDFAGAGGLRIELDQRSLPTCGRVQIDWQVYAGHELGLLGAVVFDTGVNCYASVPPGVPTVTPPPVPGVPEPVTALLLCAGVAVWIRRTR